MIKEIGSEFAAESPEGKKHDLPHGVTFTLSGRTALALALEDAKICSGTALLPDWCCASMIEPFRAAGLAVEFYPADSWEAPSIPDSCVVLLRCNYFGYGDSWRWEVPENFRRRGGVIIEDISHSLLSRTPAHPDSDYLAASLRKWGPLLCGGLCVKRGGPLRTKPLPPPPEVFLAPRRQAMELKAQYLQDGDRAQKEQFLALFAQSNGWLGQNWQGMAMDEESLELLSRWDVDAMRRRRRENARFLHDALAGSERVRPLYSLRNGDCPLFVPVAVTDGGRDELQRRLIARSIYCPVHWPRPDGCSGRLYDTELSLVCDQRYSTEDMARIIEVINHD